MGLVTIQIMSRLARDGGPNGEIQGSAPRLGDAVCQVSSCQGGVPGSNSRSFLLNVSCFQEAFNSNAVHGEAIRLASDGFSPITFRHIKNQGVCPIPKKTWRSRIPESCASAGLRNMTPF